MFSFKNFFSGLTTPQKQAPKSPAKPAAPAPAAAQPAPPPADTTGIPAPSIAGVEFFKDYPLQSFKLMNDYVAMLHLMLDTDNLAQATMATADSMIASLAALEKVAARALTRSSKSALRGS